MKPFDEPIYVTRPQLPPLSSYVQGLEEIWRNRSLTNRGPVHERFRSKLETLFRTPNVSLFANGTLALQIALQGLRLSGDVITTPFTFAASVNALVQAKLQPVFADIEPTWFTLDPDRVEAAITPRTSAILAVHVFGFPCQVDRLAEIATRRGLALVYDAAHAFGVTIGGQPIGLFGDASVFSFHATKPFQSAEGGAVVCARPDLRETFERLANHGLDPAGDVGEAGTNAKLSELHALMGELLLEPLPAIVAHAGLVEAAYREGLAAIPGIALPPLPKPDVEPNHAFMPILIDPNRFGCTADQLQAALTRYNVYSRRYFYPPANDMAAYRQFASADPLTVARSTAAQVLALPSYGDLPLDTVRRICAIIAAIARTNHGN